MQRSRRRKARRTGWGVRQGALRTALRLALVALSQLPAGALAGPGEPPVPPGADPGGIAVALIDTGVNYTLPLIARGLARNQDGSILGHDFADGDREPFDLAPGAGNAGRRHGTGVAAILLREAPEARLVTFRYKAGDPSVFARIVEAVANGPARIISMSLGGYRKQDWEAFRAAAAAHPELLFILSAGNDGRNLDEKPIYPAAFSLENAVVVASTDAFARLPPDSNWGPKTVHVSTPAERLETIDHNGTVIRASGSSYAVPRIAALATRLKAQNPNWTSAEIRAAIFKLAGPSPADRSPRTKHGWIPDPARAVLR